MLRSNSLNGVPMTSSFSGYLIENLKLQKNETLQFKNGEYIVKQLWDGEKDVSILQDVNGKNDIDVISRIITSFRLTDEGGVGYNQKCDDKGLPTFVIEGGLPYHPPDTLKDHYDTSELSKNPQITLNIFNILDCLKLSKPYYAIFRLALRWFNRSYYASYTEDVLLNLVICLEALFVADKCIICKEEPTSYDVRIQRYIVPFLERHKLKSKLRNAPKDEDVKKKVGNAYQIRNKIVHEGDWFSPHIIKKYGITNVKEFIFEVREYARKSLLGYLEDLSSKLTALEIKQSLEIAAADKRIKDLKYSSKALSRLFSYNSTS